MRRYARRVPASRCRSPRRRRGVAPVPPVAAPPRVAQAPARPACGDCAVVETHRVEPATERRGIVGAIAGGIAGAILGEKLAEAHRRHVMQALGAVTGALLGREIEMRQTSAPAYTSSCACPMAARSSAATTSRRRSGSVTG